MDLPRSISNPPPRHGRRYRRSGPLYKARQANFQFGDATGPKYSRPWIRSERNPLGATASYGFAPKVRRHAG